MQSTHPHKSAVTPGELLNTEQAALLLGISPQRLREITRAGKVPRAGHGRYDPWQLVPAYCENLRETAAGRASSAATGEPGEPEATDLTGQRALLALRQRQKIEMEIAEKNKELVSAKEVKNAWWKLARAARDSLLALPTRLAPQVAHSDPGRAYDLMTEEIRRVLESLAAEPVTKAKAPEPDTTEAAA